MSQKMYVPKWTPKWTRPCTELKNEPKNVRPQMDAVPKWTQMDANGRR